MGSLNEDAVLMEIESLLRVCVIILDINVLVIFYLLFIYIVSEYEESCYGIRDQDHCVILIFTVTSNIDEA